MDAEDCNFFLLPNPTWFVVVPTTITLLVLLAFYPDATENLQLGNMYILKLFQRQIYLKIFVGLICFSHVGQSALAFQVATRIGCTNTRFKWMFQTLLLGAPSYQILLWKRRQIWFRDGVDITTFRVVQFY